MIRGVLDTEQSVLVLRRAVRAKSITMSDEVIRFIANLPHHDERELENDLMRLVAYSSITKEDLSINVAERALENSLTNIAPATHEGGISLDATLTESVLVLDADDKGLRVRQKTSTQESPIESIETHLHAQHSSASHPLAALLQGVLYAAGSTLAMLLMCLANVFTFHELNILTQTYMWLWWFLITLNATTILIPIDVTLTLWRRARINPHLRTRLYTATVLHCLVILSFLVVLLRLQHLQLALYHSLGFM